MADVCEHELNRIFNTVWCERCGVQVTFMDHGPDIVTRPSLKGEG